MRGRGIKNPTMQAAIAAAMAVGGALSLAWGITRMNALGHETNATAAAIALGGLVGLFGILLLLNFLWAMRVVAAMRLGKGLVGRWMLAPATFEMFRDQEARLSADGDRNEYPVPRKTPPKGLDIRFSEDGVLIGDHYFGLSSTGISRFTSARLRAGTVSSLEFATVLTVAWSQPSSIKVENLHGMLRVPIGPNATQEAARVLAHFNAVLEGRTIANPHFWRKRIRVGLGALLLGSASAAAGFTLNAIGHDLGDVPLILAVAGTLIAFFGALLALLATLFRRRQYRGRAG